MSCILLIDNGSLRANATLQLRKLAEQLSLKSGLTIHPVSCKHSNKIPHAELDNQPAMIFADFMKQQLSNGEKEFILVPLFFGNSKALTSFIPNEIALLEQQFGTFSFKTADTIYPLPLGEPDLNSIIYDHLMTTASIKSKKLSASSSLTPKLSVLVDHGSPIPQVTAVRQHLAQTVREQLNTNQGNSYILEEAVMERREGKEYDFNGDLLEDWLVKKAQLGSAQVSVILMFFLPGSHAGEGGDIVEICDTVMKRFPTFRISISPLICEHPKLITILYKRLSSTLQTNSRCH